VSQPRQGCVVLLVHDHADGRLGTRERLFRNGYTVLVAGTLTSTRNLLAEIMPVSAVVDMGANADRAVELRAQLEQDPRFRGIPIVLDLEVS
jgi:response regulator RpfG family c-di-GMP phosphodiesterase